jgi:predicted ester cyclase
MGVAENLALHTRWVQAENSQDLSRHEDDLHDNVEVVQPGAELVVGVAAYRAMMEDAYTALPGFNSVLDDQFATDDRVVSRWRLSGTHIAESFGFPARGKHIECPGMVSGSSRMAKPGEVGFTSTCPRSRHSLRRLKN